MSKQLLFINGVAVDMPKDEIKIKISSNILSDVDKVMTAHSYSITLPRTMTNDSVFANAYIVAADTAGNSTHTYLRAALYFDGVPMFDGGRAVLNKVDAGGYSINLFWGLIDAFDLIKSEGLKCNELPLSSRWDEAWSEWHELLRTAPSGYNSGMNQAVFDTLDEDGKAEARLYPWVSPVVSMRQIMAKIAQVYGVTFEYSPEIGQRIDEFFHPLTALNRKCKDEVVTVRLTGVPYWRTPPMRDERLLGWSKTIETSNDTIFASCIYGRTDTSSAVYEYLTTYGQLSYGRFHIHGETNRKFSVSFHADWAKSADVTIGTTPALWIEQSEEWKSDAVEADGVWTIDIDFYGVTYDGFLPRLRMPEGGWPDGVEPVFDISCEFEITDADKARVGQQYSYVRNYPAIGVMDYIKEMMAHTGAVIVGSVTKPASIRFVALDEVLSATSEEYEMVGLEGVEMALTDLARRNRYTHTENDDDNLSYIADGEVAVDDTTLEAERTAFESKLKVPRAAYFKQWEVDLLTTQGEESDATYTARWNDAGDYICTDNFSTLTLTGVGVDFATLLDRFYAGYRRIVYHPKSAEVVVRLDVLRLMAVDFTRPIYIRQLSSAFVVTEISTDKGDQYKLKLVKI